jgi:hypothetical protein
MPVTEKAIETPARMLGSDRSRGYCPEMICADFFAGADLGNGDQETLLFSMTRFFKFPRRAGPFPPIELRGASYRGRPTPILLPPICSIVDLLLDDLAHFFKRGELHRTFPFLVILVVFRRSRLEVDFEVCLVEHFATGIQET